ncbi:MAG: thiolase family protein [Hyphomicrobiales bacterium]|nr:thiolase family protein [Hyphomicrobiales bacterium]
MDGDIVAIAAARTALGSFGGSFRQTPVYDLGAAVIEAVLERAGVPGEEIDRVILGHCRQAGNGPNPARTASVKGGIPTAVPAVTVNMACPSAMKAVMLAGQEIASGNVRIVLAGGMESMSTMPYLLKDVRWEGFKLGDKTLSDAWSDTIDPLCGFGMGMTAENQVQKYGISRAAQDEFALASQQKAAKAQGEGLTEAEIVPVKLPPTRRNPGGATVARDETIRPDTNLERLSKLKPVFLADGSVTAGNSCAMGDGACAILLTSRGNAKAMGLAPLFSIVSAAEAAVEPATMGDGPARSVPLALEKAGMSLDDMDFIEINEAFAAQIIANERALKWDRGKLNLYGGAIALGHPTGISGARILITLDNILRRNDKELGVAGICGGGGVTTAMVIRREG